MFVLTQLVPQTRRLSLASNGFQPMSTGPAPDARYLAPDKSLRQELELVLGRRKLQHIFPSVMGPYVRPGNLYCETLCLGMYTCRSVLMLHCSCWKQNPSRKSSTAQLLRGAPIGALGLQADSYEDRTETARSLEQH